MATREETIRYVYKVSGDDELTDAARAILGVGEASAETQAAVRKLADEFAKTKNAGAAAEQYTKAAAAQKALAEAAETAGLKLKLSSEQQAGATKALEASEDAVRKAKEAVADYAKQTGRTAEKQQALREAVRDATKGQREARDAWRDSGKALKDAEGGYRRVTREQKDLSEELRTLDKRLESAGVNTRNLAKAQETLATRSAQAQTKMAELARVATAHQTLGTRPFADIEQDIRKVEDAYKDLARSGQLSGRALAQAQARMIERTRELKAQTNGWVDSLIKVRSSIAPSLGGLLALGRTLQVSARASLEFGTNIARIGTLLDDTSGLDQVAQSVKDLATQFGGTTTAQAQAFYDVLSAGFENAADAAKILQASNQLAIGSVTELGVSTKGLVAVLNAYGLSANDATRVADSFFVAAKGGATSVTELSQAVGQVAAQAASAGIPIETLMSAIAALTNGGIETAAAVTQLSSVLQAVTKPTDEAQKLAKSLGLEFSLTAVKTKGLQGFLESLITATGGNTQQIATLIGRVEGLRGVLSLTGNQADDFARTMDAAAQGAGEAAEAFDKIRDTPAQDLARFQAAIESLKITLGDVVVKATPALDAFSAMARAFGSLPGGIQTTIVSLAAGSAAIGLLGAAFNQARPGLKLLTAGLFSAGDAATATGGKMSAASANVGRFGAVLRALPPQIKIAFVLVGLLQTSGAVDALFDKLEQLSPAMQKLREEENLYTQQAFATVAAMQAKVNALADVADLETKNAEQVARLSAEEATAYGKRLNALQDYADKAVHVMEVRKRLGELGPIEARMLAEATALSKKAAAAQEALAQGLVRAATAMESRITPAAAVLMGQLADIGVSGDKAAASLKQIFSDLEFASFTDLGNVALAVQAIAEQSERAGDSVRDGLGAALRDLSNHELGNFLNAAQTAFAGVGRSAKDTSIVLDGVLNAALDDLGLSARDAGADAVESFQLVARTGRASAAQLGAAFTAALAKLDSEEEVKALEASLRAAAKGGGQAVEGLAEKLEALRIKLEQIKGQDQPAPPPDPALQQTQQQLEDVGQAAEDAGEQIAEGIQRGTGLAASLAAAMGAAREEFVALSDAAAKLFDEGVERRFSGGGILTLALEDYKDALAESARVTREAIERQRADLAGLVSSIGEIGAAASEGFAQFDGSIVTTQQRIAGLLADVESGTTNFRLLGEEELQPLQAALEAARQRTQALQEAALQAAQQLEQMAQASQDAIDRAQGDDKSIEDRRFQRELERIQELAEKGGAAAREQAERARKLSRQEHEIRLREIEERKRAEIDADNKVADLDQARRRRDQAGGGDVGGGSGGGSGAGGLGPATKIDINLHATSVDEQSFKALVRRIKTEFDAIARRSR